MNMFWQLKDNPWLVAATVWRITFCDEARVLCSTQLLLITGMLGSEL